MKDLINKFANIVSGMIGALIVLLFWNLFTPNVKPIATVNLTGIVKSYVQEVAKFNLQPSESAIEVKKFATKLENNIKLLARKKGVVIVPNEAVIAGAKDLTPLLIKELPAFQTFQPFQNTSQMPDQNDNSNFNPSKYFIKSNNQQSRQINSTGNLSSSKNYQLGQGVK